MLSMERKIQCGKLIVNCNHSGCHERGAEKSSFSVALLKLRKGEMDSFFKLVTEHLHFLQKFDSDIVFYLLILELQVCTITPGKNT